MKIDVIIPAYNAHETIHKTLASIAAQEIAGDLRVTVVDDCSERGYGEILASFSPYLDIQELRLHQNGGPGVARQYGIDHTSHPLITFIDADDTFANAFSLKIMRDHLLSEPGYHTVVGTFLEVNGGRYLPHQQDLVWMFGKLYTRAFLARCGVRFNETRANEDNGFNTMLRLCSSEKERIKFISDVVYYWHENPNSITRINNCQYSYDQSFVGYTDNMIYAIREARRKRPYNGYITLWAVQCMMHLYEYYLETLARDPRFAEQNWGCCRKYYREIFRELSIPREQMAEQYNEVMKNAYLGDRLRGIVPEMSLYEFLDKLEAETGVEEAKEREE